MFLVRQSRNRSSVKQDQIMASLRSEIVEGRIGPGEQLPTRIELERRFQVSNATLQRALDRLMREGFVYAKGTMGTFVAPRPPHLTHLGLVVPVRPTDLGYNRFFAALTAEACELERATGRRVTIYPGGSGQANHPDLARLVRHVQQHRVAGLIFAHTLEWYQGTSVLDEPGIVRVVIQESPQSGVPVVRLMRETLISKGLDALAAKGRHKLAIITIARDATDPNMVDRWTREAASRGMSMAPHWIQGANMETPASVVNLTRLLMFSGQTHRPDALMILDDNITEYAIAGLVAANIRVPDDLDVVVHCNFPYPTPTVLPVTRIGFDDTDVFRRCVSVIDLLLSGQQPPAVTEIAPIREQETLNWRSPGHSPTRTRPGAMP